MNGTDEVHSNCEYPAEYKGPKPIEEQIIALAEIFGLDPSHAFEYVKNLPKLPDGAEGWFAIPSVDALAAKHFPEVIDPAAKHCRAVQLVHTKIPDSRLFYDYRDGQITQEQLRVHSRTAHAMDFIAERQSGHEIMIVAAQLGMRHRGRSIRLARGVFVDSEFGLGSLAVCSIVLTHPNRLVHTDELHMDCPGDEFSSRADDDFSSAPWISFIRGQVVLGAYFVDRPRSYIGSVSGFLSP